MHETPKRRITAKNGIPFTEYELTNGLRVVLSEDPSIPSLAINLCYHVGSKDEESDKRGYAHLFEHLMFEGSKNLAPGEYDRLAQMAGCENNAYTTEDKTNYYLLAPANQLEFGLWLESDRMLGFTVSEESLELQKGVVIEEKKQVFDNRPYGSVNLEFPPRLFRKSGYGWDTIGDTGDIEKASIRDISSFYEKYYVPNNAVLTITGDIKADKTINLIEKYFGGIPKGLNGFRKKFEEEKLPNEVRDNIFDEIQLPGIFIAYKIPKENSKEYFEFDILSDIFSTGESSRFYNELVYKKQMVSETGCWVEGKEFTGIFYIYAILMPGIKPEDVLNEIDRIVNEVKEGKLTSRELEKVKNRIETRHAYRTQTILAKADMLSHYKMFYNDPGLVNTNIDNYMPVSLSDIQNTTVNYLYNANRVVLNYLPKSHLSK
jgi:predicted Zn-dependent peptidase